MHASAPNHDLGTDARPSAPRRVDTQRRATDEHTGLLRDPADVVQARTAQGLLTLQHEAPPAALHTAGVLAYVALSEAPTEIIVTGPSGDTLRVESLASRAREARELCEAEAEPAL